MIIRIELVNARQVVACWAFLCRYRDFCVWGGYLYRRGIQK